MPKPTTTLPDRRPTGLAALVRPGRVESPRPPLAPKVVESIDRVGWVRLWLGIAAVGVLVALFGLPFVQEFPPYRIDFDVYRTGGQVVLNGENIYGELPPLFRGDHLPFTYPPIAALLFVVFAPLPLALGSTILSLASLVALWFVLQLVVRCKWDVTRGQAARFTLPAFGLGLWLGPVRETLSFGQVNILLMAAILAGLLAGLEPWKPNPTGKTPWWGPVLVGVVASIKLTPLVFGLFYLVRRDVRGLFGMAVGIALGTGLGFAFLPRSSVEYWTSTLRDPSRIGGLSFASNQNFNGLLHRIFGESPTTSRLWLVCVIAAIAVLGYVSWRLVSAGLYAEAALAVSLVSLLASPVSWSHHWVWIAPMLVVLAWWAVPRLGAGSVSKADASSVPARIVVIARVTAVLGLLVFYLTPHWWLPHADQREEGWNVYQHLLGNCYLWFAAIFILFLLTASRAFPTPARLSFASTPEK